MPEISVIVPVYNTEKYLRRCVDSILAQTFTDFELILVDDGSTDNSGVICDDYTQQDKRIRVYHQKNAGVSAARNSAIAAAKGEYVLFVDSDDYITENCIDALYSAICNNNVDIAVSALQMVSEKGEYLPRLANETRVFRGRDKIEYFGRINNDLFRCPLSKMVPLRICKQTLFPEGRHFAEDFAIIYKWYNLADAVVEIEEALYYYMIRDGSAVHSEYSIKRLGDIETLEELLKFLKHNRYDSLYEVFLHKYLWTLSYNISSLPEENRNIKKALRKKIKKTISENRTLVLPDKDPDAYNQAYPVYMWLYWTAAGILKNIRKR